MKNLLPLLIGLVLSSLPAQAGSGTWTSLSGVGDEIKLRKGQTAFIVSVSEPVYLAITKPNRSRLGVRLKQADPRLIERRFVRQERREVTEVDWQRPFPVSGPCTIRLGSAALATMRVVDHSRP